MLIGLPRFKYLIQNLRNDHRQLERRIGVYLPLSGLTLTDAVSKTIERMQGAMEVNRVAEPDLEIVEVAPLL